MKKYITGMSVISCAGNTLEDFWNNINSEKKSLSVDVPYKAEIPEIFKKNIVRRLDRFSTLVLSASKIALDDSEINMDEVDNDRVGTVYNTSYGSLSTNIEFGYKLQKSGPDMVSPVLFAGTVANACLGHVCMNMKLRGASTMLLSSNTLEYTCDVIENGKADIVLTAGADDYCEDLYDSFSKTNYVSKSEELCKPLDKNRDGINLREAVGILVVEGENVKGKKPYAEVIAAATTTSREFPLRAQKPIAEKPFEYAMNIALEEAKLKYSDIDAIFTAASGSVYGDLAEGMAIENTFKEKASEIPVTSIKGTVGETLGSSLNLNVIAASLALSKGIIPASRGTDSSEKKLNLKVVSKNPIKGEFEHIMVNGVDVSGAIYSVILKKAN